MNNKLIMLINLSGYGINEKEEGNVVKLSNTPNLDELIKQTAVGWDIERILGRKLPGIFVSIISVLLLLLSLTVGSSKTASRWLTVKYGLFSLKK